MPRPTKVSDRPIEGEIWRSRPDGMISVSDQGRAQSRIGNLVSSRLVRGHVRWSYGVDGRSYQVKAASLVAELFLGGSPSDPVTYRNGDPTDIRAANLEIPWTPQQDQVIRDSLNAARAAANLMKGHAAVRRRAKVIGKVWERRWTYAYGVPLVDRLDPAKRAIEVLESAGVADEDINLALGIPKPPRRGVGCASVRRCLEVLYPKLTRAEIASAFGWKNVGAVTRRLRKMGLMEPSPRRGRTLAGHPEEQEGEEWREHPCGVWISSLGRVATQSGLLKVQVRPNQSPFFALQTTKPNRSVQVARIMLEAFRPRLPYSKRVFINGDFQDVRLANVHNPDAPHDAVEQIRRFPRFGLTAAQLPEVRQMALAALLDGRAVTVGQAMKIARAEYHEIVGSLMSDSLDSEGPNGQTGYDRLGDRELEWGRQKAAARV